MQLKPPMDELKICLPGVEIENLLGEGGYKIVYRCRVGENQEALKVVHIPKDPDDETFQEENIRRLTREIRLLGECRTPFLVKLGSLSPEKISIGKENT